MKRVFLIVIALAALATAAMALLVAHREPPKPRPGSTTTNTPISGPLNLLAMDDLRVGGRRILLCGVAYTKPNAMQALVTETARRTYQNLPVTCVPVGSGTPCDGKIAASFGGAAVVQCRMQNGADLAAELSRAGFLCDVPAQSGGVYTACP